MSPSKVTFFHYNAVFYTIASSTQSLYFQLKIISNTRKFLVKNRVWGQISNLRTSPVDFRILSRIQIIPEFEIFILKNSDFQLGYGHFRYLGIGKSFYCISRILIRGIGNMFRSWFRSRYFWVGVSNFQYPQFHTDPLSSTQGLHLFSTQNLSVQHQKPLSSTQKTRQFNTENFSV